MSLQKLINIFPKTQISGLDQGDDQNDNEVREWVLSTLVPNLENTSSGWGYKLFLIDRNARPGAYQGNSIRAGVQLSKCIILIISPSYATNPWLYQTIREAEYFSLQAAFAQIFAWSLLAGVDIPRNRDIPHN